jgi:multisubunit Na+/H+ antiporter MnhG subunit
VAAHLIGRAAYHRGIQLFDKTWIDELDHAMKNRPAAPDNGRPES